MEFDEFTNYFKSPEANCNISYLDIIDKIYDYLTNIPEIEYLPVLLEVILRDIAMNIMTEDIVIQKINLHTTNIFILPTMKFKFHFTGDTDTTIRTKNLIDLLKKVENIPYLAIDDKLKLTGYKCVDLLISFIMNNITDTKTKNKLYVYTDNSYISITEMSNIVDMNIIDNDKLISNDEKLLYERFKNIDPSEKIIKFHLNICERPEISKIISFK